MYSALQSPAIQARIDDLHRAALASARQADALRGAAEAQPELRPRAHGIPQASAIRRAFARLAF
jgi:hypothetical protein